MLAALVLLAFFGAWQAYCDLGDVDPLILPSPTDVLTSLHDDRHLLLDQLGTTGKEMALGLLAAVALALVAAVGMHLSPTARRAFYPLAIASQTIPVPAIAPLLVFWWGFGVLPKVVVIALVCFFPIVVPVLDRMRSVDPGMTKLLTTLGATRWQRLRLVEGPAALPGLLTGLKLSVAIAAIAALIAEGTGTTEGGLGVVITQSQGQLETARSFAAVVLLSLLSLALFAAVTLLERRLLPWAHRKDPS